MRIKQKKYVDSACPTRGGVGLSSGPRSVQRPGLLAGGTKVGKLHPRERAGGLAREQLVEASESLLLQGVAAMSRRAVLVLGAQHFHDEAHEVARLGRDDPAHLVADGLRVEMRPLLGAEQQLQLSHDLIGREALRPGDPGAAQSREADHRS